MNIQDKVRETMNELQELVPPGIICYSVEDVNKFSREQLGQDPGDLWEESGDYFIVCQELDMNRTDESEWLWGCYLVEVEPSFKALWMNPSDPDNSMEEFVDSLWEQIPDEHLLKSIAC